MFRGAWERRGEWQPDSGMSHTQATGDLTGFEQGRSEKELPGKPKEPEMENEGHEGDPEPVSVEELQERLAEASAWIVELEANVKRLKRNLLVAKERGRQTRKEARHRDACAGTDEESGSERDSGEEEDSGREGKKKRKAKSAEGRAAKKKKTGMWESQKSKGGGSGTHGILCE